MAKEMEDRIEEKNYGSIGSITGRAGVLDFKDSFDNLEKYMKVLLLGDNLVCLNASEYIQIRYDISWDRKDPVSFTAAAGGGHDGAGGAARRGREAARRRRGRGRWL